VPVEGTPRLSGRIQNERDRAIVHEFDSHVCTKSPRGHRHAKRPKGIAECFIKRIGQFGPGSRDETGPAAFLAFPVHGEVADHQHLAADILHREVHFAMGIRKGPEIADFLGEPLRLGQCVLGVDAQEHEPAPAYLTDNRVFDPHAGGGDSLQHATHPTLRIPRIRVLCTIYTIQHTEGTLPMAMEDFTRHQKGIIKRYYANHDSIQIQRLAELVSELYLTEGKKREKVWKSVGTVMEKLGVPQSRITHILTQGKPELVANLVKELQSNSGGK
jgi:hypothetical protein